MTELVSLLPMAGPSVGDPASADISPHDATVFAELFAGLMEKGGIKIPDIEAKQEVELTPDTPDAVEPEPPEVLAETGGSRPEEEQPTPSKTAAWEALAMASGGNGARKEIADKSLKNGLSDNDFAVGNSPDAAVNAAQKTALPEGAKPIPLQSFGGTLTAPQALEHRRFRSADHRRETAAPPPLRKPPSLPSAPAPPPLTGQSPVNAPSIEQSPDAFTLTAREPETPMIWEGRSASPGGTPTPQHMPATASLVGRQMAEALQKLPDKPVELALSPEELGRVKLSISAAETAITVNVLAERPETLELMRRHIEQLAREFQALGYDNIRFAFAEGQDGRAGKDETAGRRDHFAAVGPDALAEPSAEIPIELGSSNGVDLRL